MNASNLNNEKIPCYSQNQELGCFSEAIGHRGGVQVVNLQSSVPGEGCFQSGQIIIVFLHGMSASKQ